MQRLVLAALLSVATAVLATACHGSVSGTAAAQDQRVYECPMHCKLPGHAEPYTQHGPGDCPVCGMHLTPKHQPQR